MYSIGSQELIAFLQIDLPVEIKKIILDIYEDGIPVFWSLYIKNRMNRFISNGAVYSKGGSGINPGFGGKWFEIYLLKDNITTFSNNLWYQGKVPESIKDYLPDNCIISPVYKPCCIC